MCPYWGLATNAGKEERLDESNDRIDPKEINDNKRLLNAVSEKGILFTNFSTQVEEERSGSHTPVIWMLA